jgi:RNA:NAD 2'-phosphotransferase (TPT1/KptA family)
VVALDAMGWSRARSAIEKTRRRWAAIEPEDNSQIVDACDHALARFNRTD